ncbi:MAG: putative rane protein [Bryobacterales bacterium]|nr:putative rane protein [Bryobacterales bacterium]
MSEQIIAARQNRLDALRDRGERWCEKLDRRPNLIVAFLAAAYLVMLFSPIQRRLWYDELFTYHISLAPGLDRFIDEVRKLDLNPPLIYVVTRAWRRLAGDNEAVLRIPMAIAYFGASLGFFAFIRRRVGALWACVSVLLVWSSPYFVFATELRPYALLLGFFSLTLLCWDLAAREQLRPIAWAGIVVGGLGMMFSHVFAIFWLGAIYLAELVRTYRNHRIDWPMWSALLLPLISIVTYFRMTQTFEASLFPPIFQGGVRRLAIFFARLALAI